MSEAPFDAVEYEEFMDSVKSLLKGRGPDLQSAALGELVALWLVGHPDFMRKELFGNWSELVKNIVPHVEGEHFKGDHHPQNLGLKNGGML